jgi:hypothetical protein
MQTPSRHTSLSNTRDRRPLCRSLFSAIQLTTLLLLAMAIESVPAVATHRNEFRPCAADLLKAGISPEQAAADCAGALHPTELSRCAVNIKQVTPLPPQDAVSACYQVRRPLDLANCVTEISIRIPNTVASDVVNNCRRSLLPTRFSECVVALHREIDFSAPKAMETCIDARD